MKTKSASIALLIILFLTGCSKDPTVTVPSIAVPLKIEIVSGNNQEGFSTKALPDSIIIKVTPHEAADISRYSFYLNRGTNGMVVSNAYRVNDFYYLTAAWTLGEPSGAQQLKVLLQADCTTGDCKALDSVVVHANASNQQWEKIYEPIGSTGAGAFWDMHFSDAQNGIAVGDFGTGVLSTNNGGSTWNFISSPRNDLYKLSFANKDTGLAEITNNYALFTTDGGITFTQQDWTPPIIGHLSSSSFYMLNRQTILTVGRSGAIARSTDGGKSWTTYTGFNFINQLTDITCTNPATCYACGEAAMLIKTSDGGNTWQQQTVSINNYFSKIYFLDDNTGFAAGQGGALVRTIDGGTHWAVIPTKLRSSIIEIHFLTSSIGYIVSVVGEIAKTTDGGLTWKMMAPDNYGVFTLNKAYVKDASVVFGLQGQNLFKFNLN